MSPKRSYKTARTVTIINGGPSRPASATAAPAGTAETRAEYHREIDHVRSGQELREREGLVEFLRASSSASARRSCAAPTAARRRSRRSRPATKALNSSASEGAAAVVGAAGAAVADRTLSFRE